ncbi:unnamed protein product [Cyprideis torosa]|uniref:Mediator of RNA polymerase II transcription subunit 13 n=1 Tax=Cyprideis torosa TaxID=163714 RepID=A0A7R8ZHF0_9CRUS|nr:unnamed protein product [Cyprideis torosa]CAG0882395.1 unnamed protein product [Cyprideis torosa]
MDDDDGSSVGGEWRQEDIEVISIGQDLPFVCLIRVGARVEERSQAQEDIQRIMISLQPIFQDAIDRRKQSSANASGSSGGKMMQPTASYKVTGPLTWRQFHRLAGRGTEDQCEPQPVPNILLGYEKEWIRLAPFSMRVWEHLGLEPYSLPRDVAYVVITPDDEFHRVRNFFKELSSTYQLCRLGRHVPLPPFPQGILRVGKHQVSKLTMNPSDEWFTALGDSALATRLRLYANVCEQWLGPHLGTEIKNFDPHVLFGTPSAPSRPAPSPMPPPRTPEGADRRESGDGSSNGSQSDDPNGPFGSMGDGGPGGSDAGNNSMGGSGGDTDEKTPPAFVVYLVDPFTYGSMRPELYRLVSLAMLRCYQSVLRCVPENMRNHFFLQVIQLETILSISEEPNHKCPPAFIKGMALQVYSQCRRTLTYPSAAFKSLTGFGPASAADSFLKEKEAKNMGQYMGPVNAPFILAGSREKKRETTASLLSLGPGTQPTGIESASVLYLSYCLSEDQRWLLASATDERGEILETNTISIHIPQRSRRRKASARRIGLQKLMDFALQVMSRSVYPWRLVVGRLGRIGHGELKGWSSILSRKSLQKYSKQMREACRQCTALPPMETPCLLSACLVSLEPDPVLRMMSDQYTPDDRFGANNSCSLSTPQDVSATHMLVFPTSATTQSSQATFQQEHINPITALNDDELMNALNEDMTDAMDGLDDIFSWGTENLGGDVGTEGQNGPGGDDMGNEGGGGNGEDESCRGHDRGLTKTSRTGVDRYRCPAFLKAALHLHSHTQSQDDDLFSGGGSTSSSLGPKTHPLDSTKTTDVLSTRGGFL